MYCIICASNFGVATFKYSTFFKLCCISFNFMLTINLTPGPYPYTHPKPTNASNN